MNTYKRIGAAKTTLSLIRYLVNQESPVSVNTVAEDLNMSKSNAMSYLVTLEDEGFARYSDNGWEAGLALSLIRRKIKDRLLVKREEISKAIQLIDVQENEGV